MGGPQQPSLGEPEPPHPGWPQQTTAQHQRYPSQQRPASGFGDLGYPADAGTGAAHDPYAALRPDGYGGHQQAPQPAADPYGLAGYTAPQQAGTAPGYAARPAAQQQPAYDPYAPPGGDFYGQPGGQPAYGGAPAAPQPHVQGYGAQGHGYAAEPAPAGYDGGYAAPPAASYAARTESPAHAPADQWAASGLALDPHHDYGHGQGYAAPGGHGQWGPADAFGDPHHGHVDPALGHAGYPQGVHPHQQQGTFDQSYADDDALYDEEPRGGGWKKAAVLVACMVAVGGGMTFAYSSLMGSGGSEPTPLVRGAEGPAKVKPSEPGGKQFAHTDSKIMGRLGEGAAASDSGGGVRKVPVVTVGRDGSIQPPAASEQGETRAMVQVPGLTVIDGLGGPAGPTPNRRPTGPGASPPVQMVTAPDTKQPAVVMPPASRAGETGAVPAKAAAAPKAEAPKKVAAADPSPPATPPAGPRPSGAGYVAVLASVPASSSSRITALTQFADMQQKYGSILSNKTPDIQEANLGAKGVYHRLLVGPPGSRDSANQVCNQLKAEGYNGCWITAY